MSRPSPRLRTRGAWAGAAAGPRGAGCQGTRGRGGPCPPAGPADGVSCFPCTRSGRCALGRPKTQRRCSGRRSGHSALRVFSSTRRKRPRTDREPRADVRAAARHVVTGGLGGAALTSSVSLSGALPRDVRTRVKPQEAQHKQTRLGRSQGARGYSVPSHDRRRSKHTDFRKTSLRQIASESNGRVREESPSANDKAHYSLAEASGNVAVHAALSTATAHRRPQFWDMESGPRSHRHPAARRASDCEAVAPAWQVRRRLLATAPARGGLLVCPAHGCPLPCSGLGRVCGPRGPPAHASLRSARSRRTPQRSKVAGRE